MAYSFYESDNRVIRYAESLAARGDIVDVIALRAPGAARRSIRNGVSLLAVQARARNEKAAWAYLVKILWFFVHTAVLLSFRTLRRPYDVVHVHNIPDFLVFVTLIPKIRGARVILDIHDLVPELYLGKFAATTRSLLFRGMLLVERLSCSFADHVIVANHLWHETVGRRSSRPDKCTVLLNYPDLTLFRRRPRQQKDDSPLLFLYPGTLNHHQGVDLAIDAFAIAAPAMPRAELHIYGDGPALTALQKQVRRLQLERVRFMERVPLSSIPDLLSTASVGLVPKRADGFGNEAFSTKILEFMASGVVAIVARTRIDQHYFNDQVVRFFDPGSVQDLSVQLRWAFDNPLQRAAIADRAALVVDDYGWARHVAVYLRIVDSGRSR